VYFFKCIFLSRNSSDLHVDNCRVVSKALKGIVSLSQLLSFLPLLFQFLGIFNFYGKAL